MKFIHLEKQDDGSITSTEKTENEFPAWIDAMMASFDIASQKLGFKNYKEFLNFLHEASEGLQKFGGGFASTLGVLLCRADDNNKIKIARTWMPLLQEHADLYRKYKDKMRTQDEPK